MTDAEKVMYPQHFGVIQHTFRSRSGLIRFESRIISG